MRDRKRYIIEKKMLQIGAALILLLLLLLLPACLRIQDEEIALHYCLQWALLYK